ncbi:aquaporin [Bacteroidota bacterium]|nr:aquaporin [Bacteroidota bacterium]MDC3115076.1 aquaporin [Bacteroidota bacterium]MDC3229920.1 aquaporin [Bacteroidota bacterium]
MFIGITLAIIIYIGYHISGAHYNPAVTFCIYLMKKITLKESFFYMCSQLFGSLTASYLKFLISGILINRFDNVDYNFFEIIACEILFTFFLISTILLFAVSNKTRGNYIYGFLIALSVVISILAVGNISGAVLNPAVAIGPLLISNFIEGQDIIINLFYYLLGPFIGSYIATKVYSFF